MAQVANCPQCEHDLLVPDGTVAGVWSRCPNCRAFFQLKDAKPRELIELEVVEADGDAADDQSAQTVADLSSMATWAGGSEEEPELHIAEEPEDSDLEFADELVEAESDIVEEDVAEEADAEEALEAEPHTLDLTAEESPEAAAERIDAWFRSAKTLADVPPLERASGGYEDEPEVEPVSSAANSATIDLGAQGVDELDFSDDFELEPSTEAPQDIATWDDSQHMERLLAGIQEQPAAELAAADDELMPHDREEHVAATETWSPDVSLSGTPRVGQPRRQRSYVRTALMTVVGGVMGLGLGYYALLWIRGPEIDSFHVAQYLPPAMLPASFNAQSPIAAIPPVIPRTEEEPAAPVTEEPAKTAEAPAETQATYTEPAPAKSPAEPAVLEAPPATPVTNSAAPDDAVRIANAPSFTVDELSTALQSGQGAEAGLVNGSMSDGKEVQQAKGRSYMILADLAQKTTFVDNKLTPEVASKLQQDADDVFRKSLANPHTRTEVGQIVPKWIASQNRKHGGVFFAATIASHASQGTVTECNVELGGGETLSVLVPANLSRQLDDPSRAVGFVGWIVDTPAEHITGYTGHAPQAVFASRLIPLE